jgi:hypothetical protein
MNVSRLKFDVSLFRRMMSTNNDPTQLTIDKAAYEATAGTMQDGKFKC